MSDQKPAKMGFERAGELEQVKLGDCLWDIHAAGMKVLEFTTGREFEDFSDSEVLRSVVRSMLTIICERLSVLERQFPGEFAKLTQGKRLIELDFEADEKVWRAVEEVLPELVAEARAVLEEWHEA